MKQKWFIYLLCVLFLNTFVSSCVDEKDFAFGKMTDTTVNPHLHMDNILSTTVNMSDFFNLDSIADTAQNVQIVRHAGNGADTGYWEFVVGIDTTLKPDIPKLPTPDAIDVTIPLTDLSALSGISGDYYLPDISQPMQVSSTTLPSMENGQSLDSIAFSSGSLIFTVSSAINQMGEMFLECPELRNRITGQIFRDTLTVSAAGQTGTNVYRDTVSLANYVLSSSSTSTIEFKYRMHVNLNGVITVSGDVAMNVAFEALGIDYVYGSIGKQVQWFNDDLNVNLFNDEDIAKIFGGSHINLESLYLDLILKTNMGLPVNLHFDTLNMYNSSTHQWSEHLMIDPSDRIIGITAAPNLYTIGTTTKRIELNTHVANNLPTNLIYAGRIEANPASQQGFEKLDSWISMSMQLHIPFKVRIDSLNYEVDLKNLKLKELEDNIKQAELILDITNYFPCSIGTVIRCYDKNNVQIGEDIISNKQMVNGANVDANGNILSASHKTSTILVTQQDVRWINQAEKVKLILTLNTSSSVSNKPFICFNKDSKLSVQVGVDFTSNITMK